MNTPFLKSLTFKIGLTIISIEVIVLSVIGYLFVDRFSNEVDRRVETRLQIVSDLMNAGVLTYDSVGNRQTMEQLMGQQVVEAMIIGIGQHIFHSLEPAYQGQPVDSVPALKANWFSHQTTRPFMKRITENGQTYLINVVPIAGIDGGSPTLFMYLKINTQKAEADKAAIRQLFLFGFIVMLVTTSLTISLLFNQFITSRLKIILAVLNKVAENDLTVRVMSASSADEIGSLTQGVNAMVSQLERYVSSLTDSERKYRQLSNRLRVLSGRLAETEENERKQLARELHDQTGRNLTLLGLNLHYIRAEMADVLPPHNQILSRVDDSQELVMQTSQQVRNVMATLRPPMLDDYGLISTLHWYAGKLIAWTRLQVQVTGQEPNPRLAAPAENALFRIVQEATNNVAKHAQASQVTISLMTEKSIVRLEVADDGQGFVPAAIGLENGQSNVTQRASWGLLTMAERAEAIGGHLQIDSTPGRGTTIIVEVETS